MTIISSNINRNFKNFLKKKFSKIKIALIVIKKIKNWPVYFLDYFKLIKNKYIVYLFRNGQKIKIRTKTADRVIINEIFIKNDYIPKGFEITNKDIVVDIGAQIGSFSVLASGFALKVYSFEPIDDNFKLLKENIAINKIKNIYPFRVAVSAKKGEGEIFISDNNSGGHSFYKDENSSKKITVPTISLQDFVLSQNISAIDFLKIDCEGSEYDILFNCPDTILNIIKKISMEYHNIDSYRNATTMKNFLKKHRFAVVIISNNLPYLYAKK